MDKIIRYSFIFIAALLLQILVFNNVPAIGLISPYFYLIFILMLPETTPKTVVLFLSFIMGLIIDLSITSLGVHASACVMMAFARPWVLRILAPRIGYETNNIPILAYFGTPWALKYTFACVTIHHAMLYFCFTFSLQSFGFLFIKMLINIALTVMLIILTEYFVIKK